MANAGTGYVLTLKALLGPYRQAGPNRPALAKGYGPPKRRAMAEERASRTCSGVNSASGWRAPEYIRLRIQAATWRS